jgi:hypothetical protein
MRERVQLAGPAREDLGAGSKTIVTEQLRQAQLNPRKSGGGMCSKLVAEIKLAETSSYRFLSRTGRIEI